MRHNKRGRHLSRTASHRSAMLRNMVTSLFIHGKIVTTPAKAKEARPFAEKMITLAKRGTLHDRRRALSLLQDRQIVKSLFDEIGPRYKDRPGGYCRILHLSKTRVGDGAPQVLFELVEAEMPKRKRKVAPAPVEAPVAAATETAAAPADQAADAPAEDSQASTDAAADADFAPAPDADAPEKEGDAS